MPGVTQVSPDYGHYEKAVHSHGVIPSINSHLKWYDVARSDQPVEQEVRDLARDFLAHQKVFVDITSAQELGFVLLHRCGEGFYFLGLCTWRGNNELWKTIYYFDAGRTAGFAPFPQEEPHKDTFCVWELAVVCHEAEAWTTYLLSDRTDQDAERYLTTLL